MTSSGSALDSVLVDSLPVAAAIVDRSLILRRTNPVFVQLTGQQAGEPLGRGLVATDRTALRQSLSISLTGADSAGRTIVRRAPARSGQPALALADDVMVLNLTWRSIAGQDGLPEGLCLVAEPDPVALGLSDKSDAARVALDTTRMLAAASHDLRQPLQVLSMIHGLLRQSADPETDDLLDDMQGQLVTLAEVVDAFLYVDRLEGGGLAPSFAPVAVRPLFEKLVSEVQPLARAAGLRVRLARGDATVISDRILLEQMLRNLLSNAIRYTHEGGIVLGCRRRGDEVAIQVTDSGIGIAPDAIDNITRPFFRIDEGAPGAPRRLGLGLAIVERLARRLDHRLEIRSTPGRGSTFAIIAGAAPPEAEPVASMTTAGGPLADLPRLLVGVVEDDPRVEKVTVRLLRSLGCQVASAPAAADLLSALAEIGAPPDLLLIDYRLASDTDGLAAISDIREALGLSIPAIVITGDSTPETIRRIDECGHVHIPKPVDLAHLQTVMRRLLLGGGG